MEVDGDATQGAPATAPAAAAAADEGADKIDMVIRLITEHRSETRAMDQQMRNITAQFATIDERQARTDAALAALQDTISGWRLDERVAALESSLGSLSSQARSAGPSSASSMPTAPQASTAPPLGPVSKKAKGIPPSPSPVPGPRAPPPRGAGTAPVGRPSASAPRSSSARPPPTTKAVVGGFPRELPKAAYERFWTEGLVPALGAEFGEHGVVVSSNLGSKVLLISFTDNAMLGEFIGSFRSAVRQWADPRDGVSHVLWARADRTLEERAVGVSFGAGWQRLRAALIAGGRFDAATMKLVTDFRRGRLMVRSSDDIWPICELVDGSLRLDQASLTFFGVSDAEAEAVRTEMVAAAASS